MGKFPSLHFVLLSGLLYRNQFRAPSVEACTRNETKFCLASLSPTEEETNHSSALELQNISRTVVEIMMACTTCKTLYASSSFRNEVELFVAICKNICWVSLSSMMRKHFLLKLLHFYLNMKLRSVWC